MATQSQSAAAFYKQLGRLYGIYTGAFLAFIIFVGLLELLRVPNVYLGYLFVFFTLAVYAIIGVATRTAQVSEYYVAGRRVPAFYNGMATGADWMSAASFVGMAGTLFLARLRRHRLGARLDRRVRAGLDPGRALPAQVRRLHRARLHGVPVRRQLRALPGRDRARVLLLHLCDGADLRHRPHRVALPRHERSRSRCSSASSASCSARCWAACGR